MSILDALAQEAVDASDDELIAAASDLRMDIRNRDSAAFAGLTFFARPQASEFFDLDVVKRLQSPARELAGSARTRSAEKQRRPEVVHTATDKKHPPK
ncbi:MAG: hypothetical protein HKM03_03570 [Steroidobacteraceae bacterium]|nr:hypothetical protein [Steroidobacteraceae bacterium]